MPKAESRREAFQHPAAWRRVPLFDPANRGEPNARVPREILLLPAVRPAELHDDVRKRPPQSRYRHCVVCFYRFPCVL